MIRDRVRELRRIPPDKLRENPKNWNGHPEAQRDALRLMLEEVGFASALIVRPVADGNFEIIDGHLRHNLAGQAVPCLVLDVDEAEADKLLATMDPIAALAEAKSHLLRDLVADIETESGPLRSFLDGLTDLPLQPAPMNSNPNAASQTAEELRDAWHVEAGQLWTVQGHRILCGDCREPEHVDRLFGEDLASIGFTSPPYAAQRKYDGDTFEPVKPDDYVGWFEPVQANALAHLADSGSFLVNIKPHCEDRARVLYVFDLVLSMCREWGWNLTDEFCWYRNSSPGKWPKRLKNYFEPVYQFSRDEPPDIRHENIKHESDRVFAYDPKDSRQNSTGSGFGESRQKFAGGALPSNVIKTDVAKAALHSAAFPPELPAFFVKAFTDPGQIVYDPFLGSGTTAIAAGKLGRLCYGLEISPAYVAVTLQRFEDAGFTPEKV